MRISARVCAPEVVRPQVAAGPKSVAVTAAAPVTLSADAYESKLRELRGDATLVLPKETRRAYGKASVDERRIIGFALDRLGEVKSGKIRSSDYFILCLREAARLSGNDAEKFVELQGLLFCAGGGAYDFHRWILGSGPLPAGTPIEETFLAVSKDNTAAAGNNPNIVDYLPKKSTVTHHFGEFLRVGVHSWRPFGMLAGWYMDDKEDNPGDVRSAYAGVMLGRALAAEKITPKQAVDIIEWAFTDRAPGKEPPPWGRTSSGTHLDTKNYRIDDWLAAYKRAF